MLCFHFFSQCGTMERGFPKACSDPWVTFPLLHICDVDTRRLLSDVPKPQVRPRKAGRAALSTGEGPAWMGIHVFGDQVKSLYKPNEEKKF